MDDEWDLHAVVRSCSATATTTVDRIDEDPFLSLASLNPQNRYSPFIYPDLSENSSYKWEGLLDEIYKKSCAPPQPISTTSTAPIPIPQGFENLQPLLKYPQNGSISFPTTNSRSRKRKNQPKKTVRQMTQEELSDDLWAWRKYGQKPIKGSPFPRNYYRCSTSKGCGARKQVERSPTDPDIFVVSYTGEHTHPRPTHRSSLAGSSRNNFSAALNKPISGGTVQPIPVSCCLSSPASASSFSPTTPLMEDDSEIHDDEILIPNFVMSEEIFKGFQELKGGKGIGLISHGSATPYAVTPPWTPTSFPDGGRC